MDRSESTMEQPDQPPGTPDPDQAASPGLSPASPPVPAAAPCILLIDDDDRIRYLFRQALEHHGYTIVEAHNGSEGIRMYRESRPALVITDILMPEKEGLETIGELRRAVPSAKIIAISGGGHMGNLDFLAIARKLGAQLTLRKPVLLQQLLDAVEAVLKPTD